MPKAQVRPVYDLGADVLSQLIGPLQTLGDRVPLVNQISLLVV